MIPLPLVEHYAARPTPPTCDFHHPRVFMRRDGDTILRAENGAIISAGPRYVCGRCGRRVYREVYGARHV